MIRNVILDWSGTLVDDLPAVWEATNYVFRQAGLTELTMEQFRAEFRLPFQGFYDRFTPHIPMDQLEAWFHSHFVKAQASVTELPHARRFLEFCREKGLRTFLLSTMREDHFRMQASRNGFSEYFERPYLGIWDKRAKIHQILGGHQLIPKETLLVGDMEHDMETARHGGTFACAVLTGYSQLDQLRRSQPDLIVEHLGELRIILEQHHLEITPASGDSVAPGLNHPVVPTVGALIGNAEGKVLMVRTHKWSNLWGIPGGKIKYGETAQEALVREVREETGLEVGAIRLALVQDCIRPREFYRPAHFILLNYTARCRGSDVVRLNEEATEHQWVTMETALGLPLNEPTRILLKAVQEQPPATWSSGSHPGCHD